jgi:predicted metal-dependent HD superfamily phosphohydrolase
MHPRTIKRLELLLRFRYGEPWRHYHVWTHVQRMLEDFKAVRDQISSVSMRNALVWAIKGHDVVYEPTARNNELRSAQLMSALLFPFLPSTAVKEIFRLILLTEKHQPAADDLNGCMLCDLDLVVLGGSAEEYKKFEQAIRAEYAQVSAFDFRRGRRAILEGFLRRDHIFNLPHFRDKYETQAQKNLQQALISLSQL